MAVFVWVKMKNTNVLDLRWKQKIEQTVIILPLK